jgi:hypothetical protein
VNCLRFWRNRKAIGDRTTSAKTAQNLTNFRTNGRLDDLTIFLSAVVTSLSESGFPTEVPKNEKSRPNKSPENGDRTRGGVSGAAVEPKEVRSIGS